MDFSTTIIQSGAWFLIIQDTVQTHDGDEAYLILLKLIQLSGVTWNGGQLLAARMEKQLSRRLVKYQAVLKILFKEFSEIPTLMSS